MKRFLLFAIMLLGFASSFAQTEIYNRYASHTDIKVACINNMQLDSVSHIEVTMLEAIDDKGWKWILDEFDIGAQSDGQRSIMFSMRDRHDPTKPSRVHNEQVCQDDCCYIGVDFSARILYVFAALKGTPPDSLLKYLVAKMSKL